MEFKKKLNASCNLSNEVRTTFLSIRNKPNFVAIDVVIYVVTFDRLSNRIIFNNILDGEFHVT
jgi:hypothetical protein